MCPPKSCIPYVSRPKKPSPTPASSDTNPFHPLKAILGTTVAMNPVSPAAYSAPALVISLVSTLQGLSPSAHDQGSLKVAATSNRLKLYFCCLPKRGVLPLNP